jgi:tetratricopeptide (TPR) repeat protein
MKSALIAVAVGLWACQSGEAPQAQPDAGPLANVDTNDPKQLLAAVDKMAGQLKDRPKTFEVLAALGNLYYENQRYLDAVDSYRQALAMSAPAEAAAAALRQRGVKAAGELPLECRRSGPSYGLEQIAKAAHKLEGAEPAKALRCLDDALQMALSARARRGNALYLVGNPDGALGEHHKVLQSDPGQPESLFFVGAILLEKSRTEPALREEGKKYWKKLLAVAPDHPRAALVRENLPKVDQLFAPADAGGGMPAGHPPVAAGDSSGGALPPGHPPMGGEQVGPSAEQVKNVAEAVANTEMTPELAKSLDEAVGKGEALLDEGKYDEARSALIVAMPMRPDDPKLAAALGGAMRGLGRSPMAERVLGRALQLDPRSPRANYEMGLLLAARGEKSSAAERFQTVQSADPAFAEKHHVADELKKLR